MRILANLNVVGTLDIDTVANANADTDRFLVQDANGVVKYRTGAEVASDIGAAVGYVSTVKHQVKLGEAIAKGQAVYISSSDGTNMIASKASNASEGTSSKTLGLLETGGALNAQVNVITEGLLSGLDTSTAAAGDPVWLGTSGNLIFGLNNKPYAPAHLVFIGIVTRVQQNNGEIFVKVQNGFELQELHNVQITTTPADNTVLSYETSSSLYKMKSIATLLGYTPANDAAVVHIAGSETVTGTKTFTTGVILSATNTQSGLTIKNTDSSDKLWDISPSGSSLYLNESGLGPALVLKAGRKVGVNTSNIGLHLTVVGTEGSPASTGTSQNGSIRYSGGDFVLDMGNSIGDGTEAQYTAWFQGTHRGDLSKTYKIALNPNGGYVGINKLNPQYPLDVVGAGYFSGTITANSPFSGATGEGIIAGKSFKIDAGGTSERARMYVVSNVLSNTYGSGLQIQFANQADDKGFGFNLNTSGGFELYTKDTSPAWVKAITVSNTQIVTFANTPYVGANVIYHAGNLTPLSNPMTTLGDIIYGGASGAATRLAGNTVASKRFLTQTGDGTNSAAPSWGSIAAADVPTLNQNTTGSAATLTTARNFTINGTAKSFDGSANVSWTAAEIGLTSYLPLTGGTLTGALIGTSATFSGNILASSSSADISLKAAVVGDYFPRIYLQRSGGTTKTNYQWSFDIGSNGNLYIENVTGGTDALIFSSTNAATFSSSVTASSLIKSGGTSSQFLKADGSVDSNTYLTGNQTITLTGDVTGTGSTSIATTVNAYFDQRVYTRADNYLGGYYVSGGTEKPNNTIFGGGKLKVAMLAGTNLGYGGSWNDVLWISTYSGGDVKSSHALVFDKYSTDVWVSDQNFDSATWGTGYKLWHSGNLTNLNQLTNGPGYLTAESDTLATVTGRGASTSNPIYIDQTTSGGYVFRTSNSWGGWARNAFTIADGSNNLLATLGGYGGSGTSLSYAYIGLAYNNNWITFSSSAVNSQVALQQSGNQVLHAGNYSSYALPLSGGTVTGTLTISGGFDTATNDVYASVRVIRNNKSASPNNDGMWIGYGNTNSGATRIYGGGSTTNAIITAYSSYASISGNLYMNGNNPSQLIVSATNTELYVHSSAGSSRLFINRPATGNQATLYFTTGLNVVQGTAWDYTGSPYSMGMTSSSQVNDFKFAVGDIYDSNSLVYRIDTSKNMYIYGSRLYNDSGTQYVYNSGTWSISISGSAAQLGGYSLDGATSIATRIFNNKGQNHGTYSDFNTVMTPGPNYIQGWTNGPTGTVNGQWYGFMLGLGQQYGTSTGVVGNYASQLYYSRISQDSNQYLWARDMEGGTWGSWRKLYAGYADSAGVASTVTINDSNSGSWYDVVWRSGNTLYRSTGSGGGGGVQIYAAGNYLRCQYINTTDNDESGITRFVIKNGDSYHRSATTTVAADAIRSAASGSWGISITGSAGSATSASYADRIQTGNTQWTWTNGAHTVTNPNTITLWDQYSNLGGAGYPWTYGTIVDIYGRSGHEHDQLFLNSDGQIFHRNCFYGTNSWNGWRTMLDSSNYSSYTIPIGGSWYGANLPGSRWYGYSVNGGEFVLGNGLPNAGQVGVLIDGCYVAGENNGFWSLPGSNDWNARRGMYWDGSYLNFTTNTPTARFQAVYADGDITAFSDIRVKENIRPINNALDKVLSSKGVLYDRIDTGEKDNIGFIAQQLEEQIPNLVKTDSEGFKSIKYQNMVAILTEAIKEQQKQIEELKSQIKNK